MKSPESVAVAVFSSDRSSILLIQRRDVPIWVLPGGGVESQETAEEAAIREILEETGFQVKIERVVGYYEPLNRLAKRTILFECSIEKGAAQTSDETRDVKFFPLSSLPPQPPPYPEWIQEATHLGPPLHRKLTSVNYPTLFKYLVTHPILVFRFLLARLGVPIHW